MKSISKKIFSKNEVLRYSAGKKITLFLVGIIFSAGAFAQQNNFTSLQADGKTHEVPQFVTFSKSSAIAVTEFPMWALTNLKLSTPYKFELVNASPDETGMMHYRYRQTFNGIPVEGAMYILHTKDGKVLSMNGELLSNISSETTAQRL